MQCEECGTIYPRNRFCREQNLAYIGELYSSMTDDQYRRQFEQFAKNRDNLTLRIMEKLVRLIQGPVFEVGCSVGAHLDFFQRQNFVVSGIEPNKQAVAFAQNMGINVINGYFPNDIADIQQIEKKPDLIIALECVYYLDDLEKSLSVMYDMLADGGYLLVKNHVGSCRYYDLGNSLFSRYGDYVQGIPTLNSFDYCLQETGFSIVEKISFTEDYLFNYFGISSPREKIAFNKIKNFVNKILPKWYFDKAKADRVIYVAKKDVH